MQAFQEQIYRGSQVGFYIFAAYGPITNPYSQIFVPASDQKNCTHIKKKAISHSTQRISSRLQSIA